MVSRYSFKNKTGFNIAKKLFAAGLIAFLLYACVSPLDPSTPRLRYLDQNPPLTQTKIHAKSITVAVRNKSGDTLWHSVIRDTLVFIDTSVSPPALWLHLDVARNGEKPLTTPFIVSFWFHVDSLIANGNTTSLVRDSAVTQLAGFTYSFDRYPNSDSLDLKINAIAGQSLAYIAFHVSSKNHLSGEFSGSIQKYQLPVYAEITIEY